MVPGAGTIRFQYLPMMTAKTPVGLSLLDRVEVAAPLLCERRGGRAH